jgi:anti-anti-sigma factor
MMQVFEEKLGQVIVVRLCGMLVPPGLAVVEARFNALADTIRPLRVVIDLEKVREIGTAAITLMLRTARMIKEAGGMMVFANAAPNVHGVLICCRLDLVLNFVSNMADALRILRSPDRNAKFLLFRPTAAPLETAPL